MKIMTSVALMMGLAGCSTPGGEGTDPLAALFADDVAVLDLTHALSARAPFWPGPSVSPFTHDTLVAHDDGSPRMAAYRVPEHFGTHFDAPVHGAMGLASVDEVPVRDLFGPVAVVDVTAQAVDDPDYAVSADDVRSWEARHGPIPPGSIVVMRSGWASRWDRGAAYYNQDGQGRLHFPGFSEEAARYLVDERDIAGIGVDTGSVDPGVADGFPAHAVVNGSGRYHLENLASLEALPEAGAYLIVAPIKIEGGSGGQVRVFAVVP